MRQSEEFLASSQDQIDCNCIPVAVVSNAQQSEGKDPDELDLTAAHPPTPEESSNAQITRNIFRELQFADQLFNVSDFEIITELHSALFRVKQIFNDPIYVKRANDQSADGCYSRNQLHRDLCPCLVDVLEASLVHPMYAINSTTNQLQDSPHCKIASEILSTLFMYHSKKSVMTVAIPIAVKALSNANQDLVRNTTSYFFGSDSQWQVTGSILYSNNLEHHQWQLLSCACPAPSLSTKSRTIPCSPFSTISIAALFIYRHIEKLSLLQLASMITNTKPDLAELSYINEEIEGVAEVWPNTVLPHLDAIRELSEHNPSNYSAYLRIKGMSDQAETRKNNLSDSRRDAVTTSANAMLTVLMALLIRPTKVSNNNFSTVFNESAKQTPVKWSTENSSIAELQSESLDKKMEDLAVSYKMRSNGSLGVGNPKSRSFMSLTNSNNSQLHNNNSNHPQHENLSRCSILEENQPANPDSDPLNHLAMSFVSETQTLSREPRVAKPTVVVNNQPPTYAQATQQPQQDRQFPLTSAADHHNAAMQIQYGTILQQILPPPPTSKSNTSVIPLVHLGKDVVWVPSSTSLATSLPSYEETTIFPVNASASVVQTTSNSAGRGRDRFHNPLDGTMSGSFTQGSKTFVDEHSRFPRPQSADLMTLGTQTMPMAAGRRGRTHGRANDLWRNSIEGRGICTVEGSKGTKSRMRVHFSCQTNGLYCIFNSLHHLFAFKTHIAPVWLHLMFLQVEARSIEINGKVLTQESDEFQTLDHCWRCLSKEVTRNKPFVTLVTSAFPSVKEQCEMLKELQESRFFDSFSFNAQINKWSCFSCSHPEKVQSLLRIDETDAPLLEGQLKEKRGRWRLFKRWQTKYFLLSSAALVCSNKSSFDTNTTGATQLINPSIALRNIRSVKSLSRGRKSRKSLPKSFEVCTDDQVSYVLKANDRKQAEEWFHCLQIAVAQAQREKI
uniref:PH domain-containing protein n=1 Tax=Ditylenchus dipsaci TaxID=166011 RepID=A0A915EV20_9BILA